MVFVSDKWILLIEFKLNYRRGRHHEFRGQKTVSGMLNWINDRIKMEVKRSTKLEKCEELD